MKKVLIVITKGEIGGAQIFVETLAKDLTIKGWGVTVAFGDGEYLAKTLSASKIGVVKFPSLIRTNNPITNIKFIIELKKYLDSNDFDVVHFNSSNALLGVIGAKLSKKHPKTVFTFHGLSYLDPNHQSSPITRLIYWSVFKLLLFFVDEKVFVSNTNREEAIRTNLIGGGHLIYNARSVNYLNKSSALSFLEEKIGSSLRKTVIIGSIGRFAYPKNFQFLIRSMSILANSFPSLRLIILGDGPQKKECEEIVREFSLENKIFIPGEIPDAAKYVKAFDIFVLPSFYEGLSMTVIEAISAGLPVLISQVGGNPEIVENNDSQLFNPVSGLNFRDKLRALINNKMLLKKLSVENLQISRKFSQENMVDEYEKIYNLK